jgi:hypothetical protein
MTKYADAMREPHLLMKRAKDLYGLTAEDTLTTIRALQ